MNIAFAGLRHEHILLLAKMAQAHPALCVTGYWEADESARAAAAPFFSAPAYESYEALLQDEHVEIVAIGDYYGIRGQRVIQALKAGKHVMCDKPVCTSLKELDEIERLCAQRGLKLGCMLDLRYDPALRKLAELVRDGELGEIRTAAFTGQHPLNWGVRPMWYFEAGKHGGTFNDIAIHGLDALHLLTGFPYVSTRYARQWNAFASQAPHFCDCAQLVGELANGAAVMADVSYSAPAPSAFSLPSYWRFTLWGSKGFAECRLGENAVTLARSGDPAPTVLPAGPVDGDYLTDLLREIAGETVPFDTAGVLASARAALTLQQFADHQKG